MACPSNKHAYRTQAEAIASALRSSKAFGRPLRIYRCLDCKKYHLTKQARR